MVDILPKMCYYIITEREEHINGNNCLYYGKGYKMKEIITKMVKIECATKHEVIHELDKMLLNNKIDCLEYCEGLELAYQLRK